MITSCAHCCFHDRERRACVAGQACITNGEAVVAPGFCRVYRGKKWRERIGPGEDAVAKARHEAYLKFDLVLVFDERKHNYESLDRTFDSLFGYERIIVADVTGPTRKHVARSYVAGQVPQISHQVDCTIEPRENFMAAVDYVSRLVKSPYFLAIEAGRRIDGLSAFYDHVNKPVLSRAVFWHLPYLNGWTHIVQPRRGDGLYVTAAYRQLGGERGKPFHEKLAKIEAETGFSLSWLLSGGEVA